jgi:hypothetical protein
MRLREKMNRACGTYLLTVLCAAALGATLGPASSARAAGGATPQPQKLWKQFPLRQSPSKSSPSGATRGGGGSPRTQAASSGGHSVMPWVALLWAGWLVAAVSWALAFSRLVRKRRNAPPRSEPAQNPAVRPENDVRAALQDVLRASKKRAGAKPASEPSPKLKRPIAEVDPVEKLKQKSVKPTVGDARQHEVSVLKKKSRPAGCHIEWLAGGEASRFLAKARTAEGSESIVSSSPSFKWEGPTPPPTSLPRAAKAHAELVHDLKEAGWMTTGRGEDWYSLELQRRPLIGAREGDA